VDHRRQYIIERTIGRYPVANVNGSLNYHRSLIIILGSRMLFQLKWNNLVGTEPQLENCVDNGLPNGCGFSLTDLTQCTVYNEGAKASRILERCKRPFSRHRYSPPCFLFHLHSLLILITSKLV
jgi:hypothetical protein